MAKPINVQTTTQKLTFNGKDLNSMDELPPDIRKLLQDSDGDGTPDIVEEAINNGQSKATSYTINGKTYKTYTDIPPEQRKFLEDKNNNSIPDYLEDEERFSPTKETTYSTPSVSRPKQGSGTGSYDQLSSPPKHQLQITPSPIFSNNQVAAIVLVILIATGILYAIFA